MKRVAYWSIFMGRTTHSVQRWIFVQQNLKLPTHSVRSDYLSNKILNCPHIMSRGEYLSNQILNCPHILSLPDPGARSPHESEIPSTQCSRYPPSWLPHPARELYSRHSRESIWSIFLLLGKQTSSMYQNWKHLGRPSSNFWAGLSRLASKAVLSATATAKNSGKRKVKQIWLGAAASYLLPPRYDRAPAQIRTPCRLPFFWTNIGMRETKIWNTLNMVLILFVILFVILFALTFPTSILCQVVSSHRSLTQSHILLEAALCDRREGGWLKKHCKNIRNIGNIVNIVNIVKTWEATLCDRWEGGQLKKNIVKTLLTM